jgi:HlyD family secretion protein
MLASSLKNLIAHSGVVTKATDVFASMARLGYGVVIVCVFGFIVWTGLSRLDSAVVSSGSVTYESRRKVVQHFEGCIVQDILVREGQSVDEGQVLFRLDSTPALANLEVVLGSIDGFLAQEARLIAERDDADAVIFSDELLARANNSNTQKIMQDQTAQFNERRSSINGQIGILEGRVQQYESEINGLKIEFESAEKQLSFIRDELAGVRDLAEKGLVPKSRWLALEREAARLQGIVGRNEAETVKARNSISDVRLQVQQARQKQREEVSAALQETRQKMNDARERGRVAQDVLRRVDVLAPRTGKVQNVKLATRGAVVRAGDVLAEVAPLADELIIEAQVSPQDVDKLYEGAEAEVRFPNLPSRTTPVVSGKVSSVSRDRLIDEATRQPYFLAQIAIRDTNLPQRLKNTLIAGMQAEVIIPTGERTILQYLVQPLGDAFAKTFRER